jgi:hypothetical protein
MENLSRFASINAEGSQGTSGKYAFIPTTRVISALETQGWFPVKASEKRVTKEENRGFQEHLIRFRHTENMGLSVVGDILPEIVVKNSHNGLSSFQIMAGLFRLVCSNGMIVADSLFATHRIKHIGYRDQDVIDATFNVIRTTPQIMDRVGEFKQIVLSPAEQLVLAESALTAKYGEPKAEEVDTYEGTKEIIIPTAQKFDLIRLALPTRRQDRMSGDHGNHGTLAENTLWNSFNIFQEKLVEKGGRFAVNPNSMRIKKARGVTSVSENVRLNQSLWALTQKMAELKGGV